MTCFRLAALVPALAALGLAGCSLGEVDTEPEHRLLVIGWDGATFDLIDPLVRAGRLPHLAGLIERGHTAQLDSTIVPISSAAWVGAVTGATPGHTGVYGFFETIEGTYSVRLAGSRSNAMPPLWRILGWHGLRSIVFGVPLTWPPEQIDGVLVSGMLAPFDADYAHPPGLAADLRAKGFQPDLGSWREAGRVTRPRMSRQLAIKREVLLELMAEEDWDFAMVVFKSLDVLGHRSYDGTLDGAVAQWYGELDLVLGELIAAAGEQANVIVLSDHGFHSYRRNFFTHAWLVERGFAVRRAGAGGARAQAGVLATARAVEHQLRVGELDLARTRALADAAAGNFGGVRLNLAGREPQGIVAADEAEALLVEIEAALRAERIPGTDEPLVVEVVRANTLYPGPFADRLPDLLFETASSVAVRSVTQRKWFLESQLVYSDHARSGIWIAAGPSIAGSASRGRHDVFDLAPTALHLLGLPVHTEMQGVNRAGGTPALVSGLELAAGRRGNFAAPDRAAEGEAEVLERLRALGYLDAIEPVIKPAIKSAIEPALERDSDSVY